MDTVALILPLVGVVVGAALAYLFGARQESLKWQRSEAARTAELRRDAYSSFARSLKEETILCRRMAVHLGLGPTGDSLDPEIGRQELAATKTDRSSKFESILLVGHSDVVTASRAWHKSVWELRKAIRGDLPANSPSFEDLYATCGHARDAFYRAARADLGVDGDVGIMAPRQIELRGRDLTRAKGDLEPSVTSTAPTSPAARRRES